MTQQDARRFIKELGGPGIQSLIERMEYRGKDPAFSKMRDAYLDRLRMPPAAKVLEIGCGTGVVARALAKREGFSGKVTGIDQSPALLEAARRFAADDLVGDRVEFHVGDAHALKYGDRSFDCVVAHTVISHVAEPLMVLREMARVVRPGGMAAIFDGDYASLTFACPDPVLGKEMNEGLRAAVFTQPGVMRELPQLLPQANLEIVETLADVYTEIGTGSYFQSFAETFAPMVIRAGLLPASRVNLWLREQRRALKEGTFFATCNYLACLARRPERSG